MLTVSTVSVYQPIFEVVLNDAAWYELDFRFVCIIGAFLSERRTTMACTRGTQTSFIFIAVSLGGPSSEELKQQISKIPILVRM